MVGARKKWGFVFMALTITGVRGGAVRFAVLSFFGERERERERGREGGRAGALPPSFAPPVTRPPRPPCAGTSRPPCTTCSPPTPWAPRTASRWRTSSGRARTARQGRAWRPRPCCGASPWGRTTSRPRGTRPLFFLFWVFVGLFSVWFCVLDWFVGRCGWSCGCWCQGRGRSCVSI